MQKFFPDEGRKEEELKARGIIIKFNHWPNSKQQKTITSRLKSSGLKKTESIRGGFETQLFGWSEGGLKASHFGETACEKLKDLSFVKRCNPDHLLPLNSIQDFSKIHKTKKSVSSFSKLKASFLLASTVNDTEAGFAETCTLCREKGNSLLPLKLKHNKKCELISNKLNLQRGKLSDYWAQELIGSDLLREELEKTPAPEIPNWIAVFDSPSGDHNIHVKNLISDEGPHAVLPELGDEKIPFSNVRRRKNEQFEYKAKGYKSTLSLFKTQFPGDYVSKAYHLRKRPPLLINNSMYWRDSEDIYEVFQKFSPSTIVVTASGNEFSKGILESIKSKASKKFDAILVGSFSPKGFASNFSNSGEGVHIMAPSDTWISSAGNNGKYEQFGGTSGAAPLVTGSLAGFEWLSGYHPTSKEAKVLLEKTAFPTLHSYEKPKLNGVGLLNAYKLGEVGKRLKKKCKNKKSCFKKEILNEENYRFDLDKSLEKDLSKVFPSCSMEKEPTAVSLEEPECQAKRKTFKRLRKTVLLNPKDSKELLKVLSCIYKEDGFSQNAEALDKLALALDPKEKVRANIRALAKKERWLSDETIRLMLGVGGFEEEFKLFENKSAIRMAGRVGASALPIIEKAFDTGNPGLQQQAIYSARRIGKSALPIIEKAFDTGNPGLQRQAIYSAQRIGKSALPIIEKAFDTGNPELQKMAIYSAQRIGGGFHIIEKAFKMNSPDLQKEAVITASQMGKTGFSAIEKAFNTLSLDAKKIAVKRAGWNKNKKFGLPILEKAFKTNNPDLQKMAVKAASQMGKTGFSAIEKAFNTLSLDAKKIAVERAGRNKKLGLPILKKAFDTGNPDLQKQAIFWGIQGGEPGLFFLKQILKNKNLNADIKKEIESYTRKSKK